jgi:hypothetical protein
MGDADRAWKLSKRLLVFLTNGVYNENGDNKSFPERVHCPLAALCNFVRSPQCLSNDYAFYTLVRSLGCTLLVAYTKTRDFKSLTSLAGCDDLCEQ